MCREILNNEGIITLGGVVEASTTLRAALINLANAIII
jgi:hypothetical protein